MRNAMKKMAFSAAISAMAFLSVSSVWADTFDFTYTSTTGTPVTATGTLTGTLVGGVYDITSGTIDVIGGPVDGLGSLLANPNFPGTTTNTTLAGGGTYLTYDDALTPTANPELDDNGLLFEVDGTAFSLWGNGVDSYSAFGGDWALYDNGTFSASLAPAPEPNSLLLLGSGLLMLVGLVKMKLACRA